MAENRMIRVGITQGDVNGIGPEVIIKTLADPRMSELFVPVVYGSSKVFSYYRKGLPEGETFSFQIRQDCPSELYLLFRQPEVKVRATL